MLPNLATNICTWVSFIVGGTLDLDCYSIVGSSSDGNSEGWELYAGKTINNCSSFFMYGDGWVAGWSSDRIQDRLFHLNDGDEALLLSCNTVDYNLVWKKYCPDMDLTLCVPFNIGCHTETSYVGRLYYRNPDNGTDWGYYPTSFKESERLFRAYRNGVQVSNEGELLCLKSAGTSGTGCCC